MVASLPVFTLRKRGTTSLHLHSFPTRRSSDLSANWISITTYGNPQPFVEFYGPAGATTTGELRITANGDAFWLNAIDFYSSTTKIPYVIEGYLNNELAFSVVDVIGNTFGAFARRPNPK